MWYKSSNIDARNAIAPRDLTHINVFIATEKAKLSTALIIRRGSIGWRGKNVQLRCDKFLWLRFYEIPQIDIY